MAIYQLPDWADITSTRITDDGLSHITVNVSGVRDVKAKVIFGCVFGSKKSTLLALLHLMVM